MCNQLVEISACPNMVIQPRQGINVYCDFTSPPGTSHSTLIFIFRIYSTQLESSFKHCSSTIFSMRLQQQESLLMYMDVIYMRQ